MSIPKFFTPDGFFGRLTGFVFRICGFVSICALAILLLLFLTSLLFGLSRTPRELLGMIVFTTWIITTTVGIIAAIMVGLSAVALIAMNWNRTCILTLFAVLSVTSAIAFVPTNIAIVHAVLPLQRIHFITVENNSSNSIDSVRLTGGMEHEFGSLNPGDSRHLKFRIERESNLAVNVLRNGKSSDLVLDEWVHPMKGRGHNRTILVNPDGSLSVIDNDD